MFQTKSQKTYEQPHAHVRSSLRAPVSVTMPVPMSAQDCAVLDTFNEINEIIEKCVKTFLFREVALVNPDKVRSITDIFSITHNKKIGEKYELISTHHGTDKNQGKTYAMWQVKYGNNKRCYVVLYESKKRAEDSHGPHGLQNDINILSVQLAQFTAEVNNLWHLFISKVYLSISCLV